MDKILSTRLDESIVHRITNLARKLNKSKKYVIETAVRMYAEKVEDELETDVFKQTFASWKREESAEQILTRARKEFNKSMQRHTR